MKRPIGVTLTAVVQVLGSLLVLITSALMLFMPALMRSRPAPAPPQIFYSVAAIYGFFAVLGFLTAIGLFRLKNWARYSTLIFAGFNVAMGLITALVLVLMPMPDMPAKSSSVPTGAITPVMRAVMAAFPLGFAVLGALWLYYFNRAPIRSVFRHSDTNPDADDRGVLVRGRRVPLSIAAIGVWNLLGGLFLIPFAFWSPANIFFGFVVTGYASKVMTLLIGVLGICVGIALLRLSNLARRVAIVVNCLWLLNAVILWFVPNRVRQYYEIYGQTFAVPPQSAPSPDLLLTYMRFGGLIGVITTVAMLYFLVTRADAFQPETAGTALPAQ
jgi:hypothetical protein